MAPLPLPPGLGGDDARLLDFLSQRSESLRALLCTLARVGVAWRREEGERAQGWITALETHPFYKGGQVLFDLLEFEDFMLDGDPPLPAPAEVTAFLSQIGMLIGLPSPGIGGFEALPPLEGGFYLYRDVVLGAVALAARTPLPPAG